MSILPIQIVFALIFLLLCLKIYNKLSLKWCRSSTCLSGTTVIVTGANSAWLIKYGIGTENVYLRFFKTGLGYQTALDLAKRGTRVFLACRDLKKAEEARITIVQETENENVFVRHLDMASFQSVRDFVRDFKKTEKSLDILINNAGAGGLEEETSVDGNQMIMQVNHFSCFLLTNLLLESLGNSAKGGRIINVASIAAKWSRLDENNLNAFPGKTVSYCNSKLCNLLFTKELATRLKGQPITAFSVHPGAVHTNLFRHADGLFKIVFNLALRYLFLNAEEGAQTLIYTAVTKNLEPLSGRHFANCSPVADYSKVSDPNLARKVWKTSEAIVGLQSD